jgi:hypothetical protein
MELATSAPHSKNVKLMFFYAMSWHPLAQSHAAHHHVNKSHLWLGTWIAVPIVLWTSAASADAMFRLAHQSCQRLLIRA